MSSRMIGNPTEIDPLNDFQITQEQLNQATERLFLVVKELENMDLEHEANDLTAEDLAQLEQRIRVSLEIVGLARLYFEQEYRWKKNDELHGTKTPSGPQ